MLGFNEMWFSVKEDWDRGQYGYFSLKMFMLLIPLSLLFILLLACFVRFGFFGRIPSASTLKKIKNPVASEIYSSDGQLLGKYYLENRTNISFDLFPGHMIDALIATEDVRFFKHSGLDWRALIRVGLRTILLQDRSGGGGSTITQQLAKNIFGRKNHFVFTVPVNKMREIFIAKRLEKVYSKEEIIELYLNTIPFGHNFYGLEVASRRYFGKSASRLRPEESATLIGMLKANTYYNPALHPERSRERRNTVLQQMVKYGFLNQEISDSLQLIPMRTEFTLENQATGKATHFRQMLRQEVLEILSKLSKPDGSEYNINLDGLKIYTTIDAGLQEYAESALQEHMTQLQAEFDRHWSGRKIWSKSAYWDQAVSNLEHYKKLREQGLSKDKIMARLEEKREMYAYTFKGSKRVEWSSLDSLEHYLKQLRAGFLAMHPRSGAVKAWVGGTDYRFFQYDHVKSRRQVGSTFKPILYYSAFKNDFQPCDFFQNTLANYIDYDNWTPRNADEEYGGWYSLKGALTNSINTVAASLILRNGIARTIADAGNLGWKEDIPKVPSIALGTVESSLMEILPIYAGLTNTSYIPELYYINKITDRKGEILYERVQSTVKISKVDSAAALKVRTIMQNVVDAGTASRLRWKYGLRMEIAGKTGTTQDGSDGWFIGCTPEIVAGAWVGGEYPWIRFRTSNYGQGAHLALPIWAKFYRRLSVSSKYNWVNRIRFETPDSFLIQHMDCEDFLTDSSYQQMLLAKESEEHDQEIEGLLEELINVFRNKPDPNSRVERSESSLEIERHNENVKKKRERKKKRQEFFDDLFKKEQD